MKSLQLTRGKGRINRKFANMRAAKSRKRIESANNPLPDEPDISPFIPAKLKRATVSIRCGSESVSFQVFRYDEKRLVMRGKAQAASSIGRRVALVLESQL